MFSFSRISAICGLAVLLPAMASAQAAISGVVSDASGAVLPDVTVEASSPALIEKVRFAGARTRANVDIYNLLNSNAVLQQNDAYDAWQTPEEILLARFFKFSVQFDF